MNNTAIERQHLAASLRGSGVQPAPAHTDTLRMDWCEANLESVGWRGARVLIHDHAGTPASASTFRAAVDVAMEPSSKKLGGTDLQTGSAIGLTSLRYEALINLVTGKHAQQFLTEMCWDGSAPTRKQLEAKLDKMIEDVR